MSPETVVCYYVYWVVLPLAMTGKGDPIIIIIIIIICFKPSLQGLSDLPMISAVSFSFPRDLSSTEEEEEEGYLTS